MRSALHGKNISDVEVTNVAVHGFWLLIDNRELFLPYEQFPWFREATVAQVVHVDRFGPEHLRWPDLDVDLTIDSIEHPERYPLVGKARPSERVQPTAARLARPEKAGRSGAADGDSNAARGKGTRRRRAGSSPSWKK